MLSEACSKAFCSVISSFSLLAMSPAVAQDLDWRSLWDFGNPAVSQQRFEAALPTASAEDALVLHTQIARSFGLRKDFDAARAKLRSIEALVQQSTPRVQVHFALEWGRTFASGTHELKALAEADKAQARSAFEKAKTLAKTHQLDALAIDAIHMFAFVDDSPEANETVAREALTVSAESQQPDAQRWQASIRHNLGYALQRQARYAEALAEFEKSEGLRKAANNAEGIHVARWMQARVLRLMGRNSQALAMQEALLTDKQTKGETDRYVLEELVLLYEASGNAEAAGQIKALLSAAKP